MWWPDDWSFGSFIIFGPTDHLLKAAKKIASIFDK